MGPEDFDYFTGFRKPFLRLYEEEEENFVRDQRTRLWMTAPSNKYYEWPAEVTITVDETTSSRGFRFISTVAG